MKAQLTLINMSGHSVEQMVVDQDDWRQFSFPVAKKDWGTLHSMKVIFEDGLSWTVSFFDLPTLCIGQVLNLRLTEVNTEAEFRAIAIERTGWKPMELPERLSVMKQLAEEKRNYELCDMQWEALSEGRGGGICPVPILSEM